MSPLEKATIFRTFPKKFLHVIPIRVKKTFVKQDFLNCIVNNLSQLSNRQVKYCQSLFPNGLNY